MPRSAGPLRAAVVIALGALGSAAVAQDATQDAPPRMPPGIVSTPHCLDCHRGIEVINATMDRTWHAHQSCVTCHKGRAAGRTKEQAHTGLIAKPGDLRVVMDTCGTCHSQFGMSAGLTSGPARDVVDRVLRSSMALATGEIAAVRYLWGEQSVPGARYGVRSIAALTDALVPGAVPAVAELPPATNSRADHLLRTRCLQCHLWTTPTAGAPPFRGAGCAACHVAYAPDGRSRSADRTISKTEVGHPAQHRIARYVADAQCLTCHRDEGLGIGWNFTGWLSADPGAHAQPEQAGTSVLPVAPDVHAAAGMGCIDCHDTWDVHGDGHVYSRGRAAVGIRCITCHGTVTDAPTFLTTRGHRLANVQREAGRPVLVSKRRGTRWPIPQLRDPPGGTIPEAHRIPEHTAPGPGRRTLTCVACHAGEVRQHFMRRFKLDERQAVPVDWAAGLGGGDAPVILQGRWAVSPTWSPVGLPMQGVNAAGEVDALIATFHGLRQIIDGAGRRVEEPTVVQTQDGRYGVGFRTADPHRTQRTARTCASCHRDPAASGLGSARVDLARLAWPLPYAPDQVADAEGTPIAAFSTPGERPLNFEELQRVLRSSASGRPPFDAEAPPNTPPTGAPDTDALPPKQPTDPPVEPVPRPGPDDADLPELSPFIGR